MASNNGTGSEPEQGRKITRLPLDCGLTALVTPLPYYVLRGIRDKAKEIHPYPDDQPYRLPFPESAIENDYKPATENPEYVRLTNDVDIQRSAYIVRCTVLLCTAIEGQSRDDLIKETADQRNQLADFITLPDDPWEATLLFVLIGDETETSLIYRVAIGQEPLTQEEVHDGVRYFRRRLPGTARARSDRAAPGVPQGTPEQS